MNTKIKKVSLSIWAASVFFFFPASVLAGPFDYVPMEKIPGFNVSGNFPDYIMAVYKFGIWSVGIAALLMIMVGGFMYITSAGNNASMEKAKGIIFDSVIGILLALTAYLLLYVINPELVKIKLISGTIPAGGGGISGGSGGGGGGGAACSSADVMKQHLAGGGGVCDSNSCSSSGTACRLSLQSYDSRIRSVAGAKGLGEDDIKMIKAIICRESGANSEAKSADGGCGLMQITDPAYAGCGNGIMDPIKNLEVGIGKYIEKKNAASGSYEQAGITREMMALASYNCCANGDNPNAQSNSCTTADGWPSLPKWACPVDPGTGAFNMCAVKGYACDVVACAKTF